MKLKKMSSLFVAVMIAISTSAFAAEKQAVVSLVGMKCPMCSQGLPRKFGAQPEVKDIKVTMEPQQVVVNFKEGKTLSDEQITKIVEDAGINVEKIERK